MAGFSYAPQEVVSAEIVELRTKENFPGQRRNYNYVVRLNTVDVDTGDSIMVNEYRSVASDHRLSAETVLSRITELIEESL